MGSEHVLDLEALREALKGLPRGPYDLNLSDTLLTISRGQLQLMTADADGTITRSHRQAYSVTLYDHAQAARYIHATITDAETGAQADSREQTL